MDKYVTRAPSWKTITYESVLAGNFRKNISNKLKNDKAANPLQIRQDIDKEIGNDKNEVPEIEDRIKTPKRRETLGSPLTVSTRQQRWRGQRLTYDDDENIEPLSINNSYKNRNQEKYSGDVSDYVNKSQSGSLAISQAPLTSTPKQFHEALYRGKKSGSSNAKIVNNPTESPAPAPTQTPKPKTTTTTTITTKPTTTTVPIDTPKMNSIMTRIQQDLNSPSAGVRLRAINAMKSPMVSTYNNFDVSHTEQNIITDAERKDAEDKPSLQDLMRSIVVYVEVRSGEDNRSEGVKKVIAALGAQVNDKLLRNTTHIVFKDGLLSTYKKAKLWNIPVVSILWIEACKNQCRICDPLNFPISNIDRYENPELYEKMKRHKAMQPDSEINKRVRVKAGAGGTPKTPSSGAIRKTSTQTNDHFEGGTPTSANSKQTDISQFFKSLGISNNNNNIKKPPPPQNPPEVILTPPSLALIKAPSYMVTTPTASSTVLYDNLGCESPATQLLRKIDANNFTPILNAGKTAVTMKDTLRAVPNAKVEDNGDAILTTPRKSIKSGGNGGTGTDSVKSTPKRTTRRRSSVQVPMQATTYSTRDMSLSQMSSVSPKKSSRRRSSIHGSTTISATSKRKDTTTMTVAAIIEETLSPEKAATKGRSPKKHSTASSSRRRTIHAEKSLDISSSPRSLKSKSSKSKSSKPKSPKSNSPKSKSPKTSSPKSNSPKTNISKSSRPKTNSLKPNSPKSNSLKSNILKANSPKPTSPKSNSSKLNSPKPNNIKANSPKPKSTSNRRTLFTPHKMETTVVTPARVASPEKPKRSKGSTRRASSKSITTPTSYMTDLEKMSRLSSDSTLSELSEPWTPESNTVVDEECPAQMSVFSSARQPGRRRTLFEVSMDIISLRLENINKTARRSLYPSKSEQLASKDNLPPVRKSVTTPNIKMHTGNVGDGVNEKMEDEKAAAAVPTEEKIEQNDADAAEDAHGITITNDANNANGDGKDQSDAIEKVPTHDEIGGTALAANAVPIAAGPKKRKLFMPSVEGIETPPQQAPMTVPALGDEIILAESTVTQRNNKRRRSVMPINTNESQSFLSVEGSSKPEKQRSSSSTSTLTSNLSRTTSTIASAATTPTTGSAVTVKSVRSSRCITTIFESNTASASAPVTASDSGNKTNSNGNGNNNINITDKIANNLKALSPKSNKQQKQQTLASEENKGVVVAGSKAAGHAKAAKGKSVEAVKKLPFLVYTNMHKEQISVVHEAVKRLGGFEIEKMVSNVTTHLVSLEPRRTLNMMRGLIRGLWIVNYNWVKDSLKTGKWLPEEQYEMKDFSRAIMICRAERQAFGPHYKCELFSDMGSFYVSSRCGSIPKSTLTELITSCGGKVVTTRKNAKYILTSLTKTMDDKIYVTPYWILESIMQMQVLNVHRFSTPSSGEAQRQEAIQSQQRLIGAMTAQQHKLAKIGDLISR